MYSEGKRVTNASVSCSRHEVICHVTGKDVGEKELVEQLFSLHFFFVFFHFIFAEEIDAHISLDLERGE
jgi:hypothetical protein